MTPHAAPAPTIPIPLRRLPEGVAIVDAASEETARLIEPVRHPRADLSAGNRRGGARRRMEGKQAAYDGRLTIAASFNRFPGFDCEVEGVYQEKVDGRIKFHTYAVRE